MHALPSRVHGSGICRYSICILFLSIIERGNDLYLKDSDEFRSCLKSQNCQEKQILETISKLYREFTTAAKSRRSSFSIHSCFTSTCDSTI